MVFEDLANAILDFVSWGTAILVIMFLVELFKLIKGSGEQTERSVNEFGEKVKGLVGGRLKQRAKGKKLKVTREKTRRLRQYVEEEKGLKDIEEIEESLDRAEDMINSVYADKGLQSADDKKELVNKCDLVGKKIKEAIHEFRKIKRRTWRANIELDKILKELREKGVKVSSIEALENNVLKLHKETTDILKAVRDSYAGNAKEPIKNIDGVSFSSYPVPFATMLKLGGKPIIKVQTDKILAAIKSVKADVDNARAKQEEVVKEVQGIIVKVRKLWK